MYITRHRDADVLQFIDSNTEHKNVLLIEGARQVGKTALIEHAIEQSDKRSCSVNLERDTLLRVLIDDCTNFEMFARLLRDRLDSDPAAGSILFIDEAQESMALGRFVRFMKEDWPCATVILSGSTLRRLFRKDTRYPVDRVKNLVLGPFSFSEYLTAVGKTALAADVLNPDVRFDSHQHDLLLGLFDAFLEAQPVDRMRVRSSSKLLAVKAMTAVARPRPVALMRRVAS